MFRAFLQKLSHQTEGIRLDYQGYFTLPWLPWNMRKMTLSQKSGGLLPVPQRGD